MKYLRLFEEAGEKYFPIENLYDVIRGQKFYTFTKHEKREIEDLGFVIMTEYDRQLDPSGKFRWRYEPYYELFYFRYKYVVYKLDDEWFYLIVNDYRVEEFSKYGIHRYYKCDQIDGLIDCLKNVMIK